MPLFSSSLTSHMHAYDHCKTFTLYLCCSEVTLFVPYYGTNCTGMFCHIGTQNIQEYSILGTPYFGNNLYKSKSILEIICWYMHMSAMPLMPPEWQAVNKIRRNRSVAAMQERRNICNAKKQVHSVRVMWGFSTMASNFVIGAIHLFSQIKIWESN